MQFDPSRTSVPEERVIKARLLGTGAAAPTVEVGQGITASLTATGVVKLTFSENPGTFINCAYMLGAETPADVKGHTVTRDTPVTADGVVSIEFSIWNASDAADNLQATEYLDLTMTFAATSEV